MWLCKRVQCESSKFKKIECRRFERGYVTIWLKTVNFSKSDFDRFQDNEARLFFDRSKDYIIILFLPYRGIIVSSCYIVTEFIPLLLLKIVMIFL